MYITWENKFPIISRNFFPNKKAAGVNANDRVHGFAGV